jgi:hypothetical protein
MKSVFLILIILASLSRAQSYMAHSVAILRTISAKTLTPDFARIRGIDLAAASTTSPSEFLNSPILPSIRSLHAIPCNAPQRNPAYTAKGAPLSPQSVGDCTIETEEVELGGSVLEGNLSASAALLSGVAFIRGYTEIETLTVVNAGCLITLGDVRIGHLELEAAATLTVISVSGAVTYSEPPPPNVGTISPSSIALGSLWVPPSNCVASEAWVPSSTS